MTAKNFDSFFYMSGCRRKTTSRFTCVGGAEIERAFEDAWRSVGQDVASRRSGARR